MYGDLWPSIRISLLTTKKTAAVLNNYTSHHEDMRTKLTGTYDMVEDAASRLEDDILSEGKVTHTNIESSGTESGQPSGGELTGNAERHRLLSGSDDTGKTHEDLNRELTDVASEFTSESDDTLTNEAYRTDLNVFVPAKNVYSERDTLKIEEMSQSMYTPGDVRVNFTRKSAWTLPEDLQVMVYPQGDVTTFPDPKGSLLSK